MHSDALTRLPFASEMRHGRCKIECSIQLIRMTLAAFGVLFGSIGTLILYVSMTTRPSLSAYAVLFLGTTAIITWSLQQTN